MLRTLIAIIIFVSSFQATAATNKELLKACTAWTKALSLSDRELLKLPQEELNNAYQCRNYMDGLIDGFKASQIILNQNDSTGATWCKIDEHVTTDQIALMLIKTINDNPSKLHKDSIALLLETIKPIVTCQTTK